MKVEIGKLLKKNFGISKNNRKKFSTIFICGVFIIISLVMVKFLKIILSINLQEKFIRYLNGSFINRKFTKSIFEGMKSNTGRENIKVICLGDSIFNNKDYVPFNDSLEDQLNTMLLTKKSSGVVLAQDNAKISSVYSQLNTLDNMNSWGGQDDYIFLSIGNNDILNNFTPDSNIHDQYVVDSLTQNKKESVNKIFDNYVLLVEKIKERFPTTKLVLSTIYYPFDQQYRKYHNVIKYWNKRVINYSKLHPKEVSGVIRTDKLVKEQEDFTHFIEPSAVGGKKIVEGIKNIIF